MTNLIIAAASALIATNAPLIVSNGPVKEAAISVTATNLNGPVEQRLKKLMEQDDESQAEVDKWIQENMAFAEKGAGIPAAEMNVRIRKRFESVKLGYEDFLRVHTNHVKGIVAYASFLGDIGDEDGSFEQLQKALKLEQKDPAIWNNLANYYGHNGPVKMAFDYYAKAIELNPNEPVYFHNFGTTVFLFRKDAMEHYSVNEQQVFDKALDLYRRGLKLAPDDFPLASDFAQTYYGIRPWRTDDALLAWTNALSLAHDEIEREGVYVHMARVKTQAGRYDEARAQLNIITNDMYADLKRRVLRTLNEKEAEAKGTNAAKAAVE